MLSGRAPRWKFVSARADSFDLTSSGHPGQRSGVDTQAGHIPSPKDGTGLGEPQQTIGR